jgi:predicted lipoprotein with Yx(FWY)xxD motif
MRTTSVVLVPALLASAGFLSACTSAGHATPATATTAPAAAAAAGTISVKVSDSSLGPILTDQNGRTLYAFTHDKGAASTCTAGCIATWPALISRGPAGVGSGAQASLLSQTTRAEGTTQATYNSWPLYYYVGDQAPGDVDGEGSGGVWFALGPDGKLVKPSS